MLIMIVLQLEQSRHINLREQLKTVYKMVTALATEINNIQ